MTARIVVAVLAVSLLAGCGNSAKPGPCQALPVDAAQHLIEHGRYGADGAAWVSTGRDSHGDPVSAVAISTVQHRTLLLGHAQTGESFTAGFWVAMDSTTQDATGFPGRDDRLVADIAAAVHDDDLTAVQDCL